MPPDLGTGSPPDMTQGGGMPACQCSACVSGEMCLGPECCTLDVLVGLCTASTSCTPQ
jgi:hypothetical protein